MLAVAVGLAASSSFRGSSTGAVVKAGGHQPPSQLVLMLLVQSNFEPQSVVRASDCLLCELKVNAAQACLR